MTELLTEASIQTRFFEKLREDHPKDILVMNWEGWLEKCGKIDKSPDAKKAGTRLSPFYGEFDIARFSRIVKDDMKLDLELYGYEVKGIKFNKRKKRAKIYQRWEKA